MFVAFEQLILPSANPRIVFFEDFDVEQRIHLDFRSQTSAYFKLGSADRKVPVFPLLVGSQYASLYYCIRGAYKLSI
jgi:hypothetical protein